MLKFCCAVQPLAVVIFPLARTLKTSDPPTCKAINFAEDGFADKLTVNAVEANPLAVLVILKLNPVAMPVVFHVPVASIIGSVELPVRL